MPRAKYVLFEVEWIAQAVDGGDFSDSSVYQGPCFTLAAQ